MNDISRTKYFSLISGIIFLIVGIYIITRPLFIAYTINIIFCVMLLIEGISQISAYLSEKREGRSNWRLVEGIISIIIGIYLVIGYPLGLPITIIVAIGIWLFFIGISKLLMGMRVVKFEKNISNTNYIWYYSYIESIANCKLYIFNYCYISNCTGYSCYFQIL